LHRSRDGTRVVNYAQLRSAQDRENLRKVGQLRAHFDRITKFGKPDAHLSEVVYTVEHSVAG